MDFKFVDASGNLVAAPTSACEALHMLPAVTHKGVSHILLDDTGVEITLEELEILCAAEKLANH